MPYTLSMGLVWFGAALVVGFATGYLVRAVSVRRPRPAPPPTDSRRDAARADGGAPDAGPLAGGGLDVGDDLSARDPIVQGDDIVGDDLTVIEGIGPAVAELCHGIGIQTWAELAATEVSLLQTLLDDAGARFHVHDPSTWPAQARLLAEGRWDEFEALASSVRGGDAEP